MGVTALRAPTPDIANHQVLLTQLKEETEVGRRIRGNPDDSFVTLGELISAGILKYIGKTVSPGNKLSGGGLSTVNVLDSVTGDGSVGSPLKLVGDTASPTASQYYGTNAGSTRGWYNLPGGGGGSLTITDGTNTVTGTTQITVTGGVVGGTTPNATLNMTTGLTLNNSISMPSTNTGWDDTSIVIKVNGNFLKAASFTSIKVRLQIDSGPYVVGSAVIRHLPHGTTTFSSSVSLTWGGVSGQTFATGVHDSDAISVSVDKDSDLWIIIYGTPGAPNTTAGLGQGVVYTTSLDGGYHGGDQTAAATTFTLTGGTVGSNVFAIPQVFGA